MKTKDYKISNIILHATSCSSSLFRNIEYFHSLSGLGSHSRKLLLTDFEKLELLVLHSQAKSLGTSDLWGYLRVRYKLFCSHNKQRTKEVADVAIALLLGLARQTYAWSKLPGTSVSGKTVGEVGFGDIGFLYRKTLRRL